MKDSLDTKLYNDYLNGNKEAFELLYNKYDEKIKYFIFNIVKDYQKAEDIAQETFMYVLQNKIEDNKYEFKNYIYLVARSKALNYINVEKRRTDINEKFSENNIVEQDISDVLIKREMKQEIIKAINELDDKYRNAIYLSKIEEFSCKETAEILEEALSNTKVLIHRGKKELRKILIKNGVEIQNNILRTFIIILSIGIIFSGISYAMYKVTKNNNEKMLKMTSTFSSEISTFDENKVWVGTFNLVWNDFRDKVIGKDIEFENGTPELVKELNKKSFTEKELSKKSYYKIYGKKNSELKTKIEKDIQEKFNENSDILNKVNWEDENSYILYSMLKKEFNYLEKFPMLDSETFGDSEEKVKYFGLAHGFNKATPNVEVLFYSSEEDFAIKLKTMEKEDVILYKTTGEGKSFEKNYNDMIEKSKKYEGNKKLEELDLVKIPFIKLNAEINYDELCGKIIKGTNSYIEQALQTVNFELNNIGGSVKSEAFIEETYGMTVFRGRDFEFNNDFILYLKEEDKEKPYFALKVDNTDVLVCEE